MGQPATFDITPLQKNVIDSAIKYISDFKNGQLGNHLDMLLAAVMRFGKTTCSYEIIRQNNIKYALVTTAKADTRTSWRNEINHKKFIDDFVFIEYDGNFSYRVSMKNENDGLIHTNSYSSEQDGKNLIQYYRDLGKTVIVFATLYDL